jgi:alcohol dehydrogenase (NADP+)
MAMTLTAAWGAVAPDSGIAPFDIERRARREHDVEIAIRYCGVCHSDLHTARNDWGRTVYPVVPGHEIIGEVIATGSAVSRHAVGDTVAVGCLVDSCLACGTCYAGDEQYCEKGATGTYNGMDRRDGSPTHGGYSARIVVREEFVLRLPKGLDPARAAPLLCAGITTYSPLKHWKVGPGTKVGVIGLGGLGHMGVKLAAGLGAEVTMITTSPEKGEDARALGATHVLASTDKDAMKATRGSLDFILDTVPVAHDISPYLLLLHSSGTLVIVGAIDMLPTFHTGLLLGGRKAVAGSAIGGIGETQELLDFCAANDIHPDCETIAMADINHAYERMERGDVRYRFVIDMALLES